MGHATRLPQDSYGGSVYVQVYELNKGKLKLVHERETDAGIKCCTFGASSLEERHLVGARLGQDPLKRTSIARMSLVTTSW